MKVSVNDKGIIEIKEVFNPFLLKTGGGEQMAISMRDSGFEFVYQGVWYSAKGGIVEQFDQPLCADCRDPKRESDSKHRCQD